MRSCQETSFKLLNVYRGAKNSYLEQLYFEAKTSLKISRLPKRKKLVNMVIEHFVKVKDMKGLSETIKY